MPGQNGEDTIIVDYLKTVTDEYPHRFLDVGAFHPVAFSNTRVLVEAGWSGVYVEPAPGNFNTFLTEYRDNDKLLLVNAAISHDCSLLEFWDSGGDALSSSVPDHVAKWQAIGVKFRRYLTKAITWEELLLAMAVDTDPISVLSLDVESMNLELFNLLVQIRPVNLLMHLPPLIERLLPSLRVFVVEHDGHQEKMASALKPYGFKQHHLNGENAIFVR